MEGDGTPERTKDLSGLGPHWPPSEALDWEQAEEEYLCNLSEEGGHPSRKRRRGEEEAPPQAQDGSTGRQPSFTPLDDVLDEEKLKTITFAPNLEMFDVSTVTWDEGGLEMLYRHLKGVESIRALNLWTRGEDCNLIDNLADSVWSTVELVDIPPEDLPRVAEKLSGNKQLRCLRFHAWTHKGLEELPDLPALELVVVTSSAVDAAKELFPGVEIIGCTRGRADEAEPTLFRLYDSLCEAHGSACSLPSFATGSDTEAIEFRERTLAVLRNWCLTSKFSAVPNCLAALQTIKVAILDSGVDTWHPDLRPAIRATESFVGEDALYDRSGHGTHCAGIIASPACGVAHGVGLYIGKVLTGDGRGTAKNVAAGVDWAVKQGVHIISMSLGSPGYDPCLHDAVQRAISADIIVICAAGNNGSLHRHNMSFPATMSSVVTVGSIGYTGASSSFSSIGGGHVDVAAFGKDVYSTWPRWARPPHYRHCSGTSMATPLVAGVCAWLLAYDRAEGHNKIRNAHCMKDLLGKLTHNPTLDLSKGRGSIDLEYILDVPQLFKDFLDKIC